MKPKKYHYKRTRPRKPHKPPVRMTLRDIMNAMAKQRRLDFRW